MEGGKDLAVFMEQESERTRVQNPGGLVGKPLQFLQSSTFLGTV